MTTGSIARRYAKALFEIGVEQGNLVGLSREVQRAAEAWEISEELRVALGNALLPEAARRALWDAVVQRLGVTRIGKNLCKLLFEKGRLAELPGIARELQVLGDIKDNRLRAELVSAEPVGEDVISRLKAAIQRQTGKTVVLTTSRDPRLIGGIITRVGDLMYDGSIKSRLERIKEEMLGRG